MLRIMRVCYPYSVRRGISFRRCGSDYCSRPSYPDDSLRWRHRHLFASSVTATDRLSARSRHFSPHFWYSASNSANEAAETNSDSVRCPRRRRPHRYPYAYRSPLYSDWSFFDPNRRRDRDRGRSRDCSRNCWGKPNSRDADPNSRDVSGGSEPRRRPVCAGVPDRVGCLSLARVRVLARSVRVSWKSKGNSDI